MNDPKITFRKKVLISILLLSIGIAQLVFIISVRSKMVWRQKGSPISGNTVINVPPNFLLPNRYVILVIGYFPTIIYDDVIGNITFTHQNSGKNYTFNYRIVGYLMYKKMIFDARSWVMKPGKYNVSWENVDSRYEYYFTTHGLFNFFPKDDKYPTNMETIFLIISIFGLISLLVVSIKRYLSAKRDYSFYKA
ncbi:MAG: hypothetical protein ACFFHD_07475 [Promethearchaeota archaeon]